jgi:hypothetical protein
VRRIATIDWFDGCLFQWTAPDLLRQIHGYYEVNGEEMIAFSRQGQARQAAATLDSTIPSNVPAPPMLAMPVESFDTSRR